MLTGTSAQSEVQAAEQASRALVPRAALWIAATAGLVALLVWVLVSFRGMPGDDPFITYRYARNVAEGNGFVYNLGERVQSTTTPLFTLLLALGGMLGADIPDFAYLLNALSLLAFALSCVGLVRAARTLSPWLGLAAAALTFLCPITLFGLGSEMPLLVALAWGSWWAAAAQRWNLSAALAALAAVTRGDGVLVGAAVAVYFLAAHARSTSWRRWPWSAAAIYAAVAAPWYIFAWLYFGSPLPATLQVKIIQGTGEGAMSFFEGLGYIWTWSRGFGFGGPWAWLALALLTVGLAVMAWRKAALVPVWVWALLFTLGYSLLNVPRYYWYYSPLVPVVMLALVLGAAVPAGFAARRLAKWGEGRAGGAALVAGFVLAAGLGGYYFAENARSAIPAQRAWLQIYIDTGRWLEANTPPGASVGASEIGFIGYYSKRRIIDFAGLIQPELAEHSARLDNLWALETYRPDYIVEREKGGTLATHPWVQERYELAHLMTNPGSDPVRILKRRD